jgi:HEAT repeat protein
VRILSLGLVLVLLGATDAEAAKAAKKGAPPAQGSDAKKAAPSIPKEKLEKVREILLDDDDAAAIDAAKALGLSGAANAIEPLVELLAVGASPARTEAALDALAALAVPSTLDVLEVYAGNRTPDVRRRAIKALGAIKDDRAVAPLLTALGDGAPDVRAAAADALAARKETKAGPRLLLLVKRNDVGAAPALGQLATPELVPQLAELQGSVDDAVVAAALGEYIKREDVSDRLRVDVIHTMARLSGDATTASLIEYLATIPAKDERPSKKEAQKVVDDKGAKGAGK